MILTCPNCYSQFNVDAATIGNAGRNVRCSACKEVWFEVGDDDSFDNLVESLVEESVDIFDDEEVEEQDIQEGTTTDTKSGDDETAVGDIPEAIKPQDHEGPNTDHDGNTDKSKTASYAIAACVFVLVLVYLLLSSSSMMRTHPSMQAFYALFGIHMELPTSVTFAKITAVHADGAVDVKGNIVNLSEAPQTLRMMELTVLGKDQQVLAKWYATPPKAILKAQETVEFSSKTPFGDAAEAGEAEHDAEGEASHGDAGAVPQSAEHVTESDQDDGNKYIRVRFVLSPRLVLSKTDEEVAENTPTPHEGESDHPNDHEASL